MDIPIFIMMVGLVGSGKTARAQELSEEYNANVFSSDELREELFGDVNHQENNDMLFKELHNRIKGCLKDGKNAIYDATNINYKRRMAFLVELKNIPCKKICVLMATPYKECLKRNAGRDRNVPEYVIERMYRQFDIPWYYEGWDEIQIEYSDGAKNYLGHPKSFAINTKDFSQDNPHHKLTLGAHCAKAFNEIEMLYRNNYSEHAISTCYAASIHDCGKIFTKQFKNSKGEHSDIAHFYNHEKCGSYDSLFYKLEPFCDQLYVATLIRWHMQPYFWEKDNNEKSHNKYKKLWGDQLYNDIMKLHKADKAAH